jgi:hypothetical protein
MTTTATLTGNIQIGSGNNPISIPIDTTLPPATAGELVFQYALPAGQEPASVISVGDFLTWATSMLSLNLPVNDLPASLTSLSIGVSNLKIDTKGEFDIGVLFGTLTDNKWSASWSPITGLPFAFNDLKLEVDYSNNK